MRYLSSSEASQKTISHPIGTTVRIERFFHPMPVRKQAIEKASTKTLWQIRRTLQSYAIARPYLRLSLKVLKAKNDKDSFKYPLTTRATNPSHEGFDLNTVAQVLGKKATDQCHCVSSVWSTAGDAVEEAQVALRDETYRFQAVFVRPECGR